MWLFKFSTCQAVNLAYSKILYPLGLKAAGYSGRQDQESVKGDAVAPNF